MTEKLDRTENTATLTAVIESETAELTALVKRHREHNATLDTYLSPLRIFKRNMATDAFKASAGEVYREAANAGHEGLPQRIEAAIGDLVALLDPGAKTYDTALADEAAKDIREDVAATKYVTIEDDIRVAAEAAITRWETAKRDLAALTPGQYRTQQGTRQGRRGPRGPGKLVQEQGFRLTMTCDTCHASLSSGSNPGSAQDAMANHAATHMPDGERPSVLYGTHVDTHRGFTDAMNRVLDGAESADGGGFHIGREYVIAA